jgi:methyl-accepting chemotaxis protein
MAGLVDIKMKPKLLIAFLIVGLIPMGIIATYSMYTAELALEASSFRQLEAVHGIKKIQISELFQEKLVDLKLLSQSRIALDMYLKLETYHNSENVDPTRPFPHRIEYSQQMKGDDAYLRAYAKAYNYHDIFIICAKHGHVMYSVAKEDDLGTNLSLGPLRDSGLGKIWRKVIASGKTEFIDYAPYAPSGSLPESFMGTPLNDANGQRVGVIVQQISLVLVDHIMQERPGLGETGETFLVGSDYRMRSNAYLDSMGRSVVASFKGTVEKNGVDTEASREALAGRSGRKIMSDYRGVNTIISYGPIDILDTRWAMEAKVDMAEVDLPLVAIRNSVILIAAIIAILVGIFAYWFANCLTIPVTKISATAKSIAVGELDGENISPRKDEIGVLMQSFNQLIASTREIAAVADQIAEGDLTVDVHPRSQGDVLGNALANMAKNLREQMEEILDGSNVLAASISQILTSTTLLASSSVETATAVTQTATTLEEVKQTAIVSAQKAKEVSGGAQQIVSTVQSGQASAQEAADGMTHIQEQMASIAESIVRFGEQSQAIGEIVSAVDDLAEQSNLLAVNAAIEATRAGEEGKGFGVVAEEIKSLAEQSKQATGQVRTILNDIQKATGTAVQAAEQGSKAVETGVDQCMRAGEAIRALNDAVTEAARNAMQIAASSQQQLVGVDQVAGAMVSIKQASTQNVSSTQQVETVVHDLDEVGQRLKGLVEMYRVVR